MEIRIDTLESDDNEMQLYACQAKDCVHIELYEFRTGNDLNVVINQEQLAELIDFLQKLKKIV